MNYFKLQRRIKVTILAIILGWAVGSSMFVVGKVAYDTRPKAGQEVAWGEWLIRIVVSTKDYFQQKTTPVNWAVKG